MQNSRPAFLRAAPVLLAFVLLTVFLATMAPGLTWANGGSDGGDLIAAAATGGVAHPTGYPVYLVLARLFQWLPFGSLASRTNLLSAVATVAAAVLVGETVRRSLQDAPEAGRVLAGLVAGAAFGLAPLVWSQAVITEVYALHGLFVGLLLYLLVVVGSPKPIGIFGIGLIQGLAAGNHVLALLMAPMVLAAVSGHRSRTAVQPARVWSAWRWDSRACAVGCLGILAGLLSYAILPIRAANHPPVNWGVPVTLQRFAWLVSGSLYQDSLFRLDLIALWEHLQAWAALTLQQTGILGLLLALVGLIVFFSPSRVYLLTLWVAIVFTAFSFQYAVIDSYVHLLPVYLAFSIWTGLGIGQLSRLASIRFSPAAWLIGVAALAYFVPLAVGRWPQVDASRDPRAERFGRQLLDQAPAQAILFAEGDRAVFGLWYFHYALHLRPDVRVVADSLLPFDWYRENLQSTYSDLVLPDSAPGTWISTILRANPGRPTCFAAYPEPGLKCSQD